MVLREDGDAVIAGGQPSHAWLSGQLARAWGNERFGAVAPWEEVCLAAEQHDVGMAGWDLEPELNPKTGRPRSFMEMALETHLGLWWSAPGRLRAQSRFAALLVSMHGTALYERRDLTRLEPARAEAVRGFLDHARREQGELLAALRDDPASAPFADPRTVARNQGLMWTWDSLSLALLLDWAPHEVEGVPLADATTTLFLRTAAGDPAGQLSLGPWPFSHPEVVVRCEGRRLEGRYGDEERMRAALHRAPWVTLSFSLVPGADDGLPGGH
jgi:hypothetical protein